MEHRNNKAYTKEDKSNDKIADKKQSNLHQKMKDQSRCKEETAKKYNPNVYSWRKSLSKDKQNIKDVKQDSLNQFKLV